MRGKTRRRGECRASHHTLCVPLFFLFLFLHTFSLSLTNPPCHLCFPSAISSRKKPDDLHLPSFSLPWPHSACLLCVLRYGSCEKTGWWVVGIFYAVQTPPRHRGKAHTHTRAAQRIMVNEWIDFFIRLYQCRICFCKPCTV